jgi:hypothetical protein
MEGGKKKFIHGRLVTEDPEWAGWAYYAAEEENEYTVKKDNNPYWYNPATGEMLLDQPDFRVQWEIRMRRSKYEGHKNGLDHYYDSLTSAHFQHHTLTNTFQ